MSASRSMKKKSETNGTVPEKNGTDGQLILMLCVKVEE
jgi:hypothetical protein